MSETPNAPDGIRNISGVEGKGIDILWCMSIRLLGKRNECLEWFEGMNSVLHVEMPAYTSDQAVQKSLRLTYLAEAEYVDEYILMWGRALGRRRKSGKMMYWTARATTWHRRKEG